MFYVSVFRRAYGVMVSMLSFRRSDQVRIHVATVKIHNDKNYTKVPCVLRLANGYQFNYRDQNVETQGKGVAPFPTIG